MNKCTFKNIIFLLQFITTLSNHVLGINREPVVTNEKLESQIVVGSAPLIKGPVKRYTTISEGDNLNIECNVDGDPEPPKTWYKDVTRLQFKSLICTTNPRIVLDKQGSLLIQDAREEDNGNYVCGVKNVNGIDTSSVFVTVLAKVTINVTNPITHAESVSNNLMDLENISDTEYTNKRLVTIVLIISVIFIIMCFVLAMMYNKRSTNKSKYTVEISPIKSISEIQHEFRKNEKRLLGVDLEEGDEFLRSGNEKEEDTGLVECNFYDNGLKNENSVPLVSKDLFDCNCVKSSLSAVSDNNTSSNPCFSEHFSQ